MHRRVTRVTRVTLLLTRVWQNIESVEEKRTEAATVRMTPTDVECFRKAAEILWPGAVVTKSGIVLGLARLCCADVLKRGRRTKNNKPALT